jgi:hypothetical protein
MRSPRRLFFSSRSRTGLADPGLAHDAHDLAAPFDRNGEAIAQELELVAAPGEHGEPAARPEAAALDTLEPVHRAVAGNR